MGWIYNLARKYTLEYHGGIFAICVAFVSFLIFFIPYFYIRIKRRKVEKRLKELLNILINTDKRTDFIKYTKADQENESLKKKLVPYINVSMLRRIVYIVGSIVFMNSYIAEFPPHFWDPFSKMVSFPHPIIQNENVKVGFVFYFGAVLQVWSSLYNYLVKKATLPK